MSEWIWVKNEAVNDIPGRIPAGVLPAWEARGWSECSAPTDDVEVDAPAPAPEPTVKPSASGPKKENDRG
jgi:hypothetical protein